jgi:hypothetical protein
MFGFITDILDVLTGRCEPEGLKHEHNCQKCGSYSVSYEVIDTTFRPARATKDKTKYDCGTTVVRGIAICASGDFTLTVSDECRRRHDEMAKRNIQ